MHECVICQHTGTCTWQILMNETHVCHVLCTDSNLYLFMAYVGLFVYSDTFLIKRKGDFIMALFVELFLLGVGLSMDAFAVSVCKAVSYTHLTLPHRSTTKTCLFWLLPPVSMHLQSESHLPS